MTRITAHFIVDLRGDAFKPLLIKYNGIALLDGCADLLLCQQCCQQIAIQKRDWCGIRANRVVLRSLSH